MNYSASVDTALTSDFSFVADLPRSPKKQLATYRERWIAYTKFVELHGPPISFSLAAKLLDLSRVRVYQLADAGHFDVVETPDGTKAITGNSFAEFCKMERKSGRPTKLDSPTSTVRLACKILAS